MNKENVKFEDLGQMDYQTAWDYQERLLKENVRRKSESGNESGVRSQESGVADVQPTTLETQHYLLFVEHPPVYTLGKSGNIENVLINEEMRSKKGIEFFRTNRGGRYHVSWTGAGGRLPNL